MKVITLEWVITTPLGTPVEPEVNRMCTGSEGWEYDPTCASEKLWISSAENRAPTPAARSIPRSTHSTDVDACQPGEAASSESTPAEDRSVTTHRHSHDSRMRPIRAAGLDT